MSNIWFCSDLHFGHKNIPKFRGGVESEEDNRNQIIRDWNRLVTKRDDVYVLGDAAFTMDTVKCFADLPGARKYLIRGNHDQLDTSVYLKYFTQFYGLFKYKEFWLSHAPIHPDELRGKVNLHGHVHYQTITRNVEDRGDWSTVVDNRYFNCCVENVLALKGQRLISLEEIREYVKKN